jgi:hypothetical protein
MRLDLRYWKYKMDGNYKPYPDIVIYNPFSLRVKAFYGSELWTLETRNQFVYEDRHLYKNRLTIDLIKR